MATEAMVNAALPHLVGIKDSKVRPVGQFYSGMTADESEDANWRYCGRERVGHAIDAAIRHMPEKTAAAIADNGRALLEVARLRAALEEIAGLSMSHFYKSADMANGARNLAINALRERSRP